MFISDRFRQKSHIRIFSNPVGEKGDFDMFVIHWTSMRHLVLDWPNKEWSFLHVLLSLFLTVVKFCDCEEL